MLADHVSDNRSLYSGGSANILPCNQTVGTQFRVCIHHKLMVTSNTVAMCNRTSKQAMASYARHVLGSTMSNTSHGKTTIPNHELTMQYLINFAGYTTKKAT